MRLSFLSGLRDPGFYTIAENVTFELGKDGQHASECAATRRCQVESVVQRYEADLQRRQLLQRVHQINEGSSPPVSPQTTTRST